MLEYCIHQPWSSMCFCLAKFGKIIKQARKESFTFHTMVKHYLSYLFSNQLWNTVLCMFDNSDFLFEKYSWKKKKPLFIFVENMDCLLLCLTNFLQFFYYLTFNMQWIHVYFYWAVIKSCKMLVVIKNSSKFWYHQNEDVQCYWS